jgi:hypothetical protein
MAFSKEEILKNYLEEIIEKTKLSQCYFSRISFGAIYMPEQFTPATMKDKRRYHVEDQSFHK